MNGYNKNNTYFTSLDLIQFWTENSFQHIDVILNGHQGTKAILQESFEDELSYLFKKFNKLYKESTSGNTQNSIKELLCSFLFYNSKLIKLLERLKFEGFNGYPGLFETVHHFIYEQKYVSELFSSYYYGYTINPKSVLINSNFKKDGIGLSQIEYIYNTIYFWSLIGSQHANIIATVSPNESNLSDDAKSILINTTNKFNAMNYNLSNIYPNLNTDDLYTLFIDFKSINNSFLEVLLDFKSDYSKYLPDSIKLKLPSLFFGVLDHIIDEHEYVVKLLGYFNKIFENYKYN